MASFIIVIFLKRLAVDVLHDNKNKPKSKKQRIPTTGREQSSQMTAVPKAQRETIPEGSTSEDLGDILQKDEPCENIWWVWMDSEEI